MMPNNDRHLVCRVINNCVIKWLYGHQDTNPCSKYILGMMKSDNDNVNTQTEATKSNFDRVNQILCVLKESTYNNVG